MLQRSGDWLVKEGAQGIAVIKDALLRGDVPAHTRAVADQQAFFMVLLEDQLVKYSAALPKAATVSRGLKKDKPTIPAHLVSVVYSRRGMHLCYQT